MLVGRRRDSEVIAGAVNSASSDARSGRLNRMFWAVIACVRRLGVVEEGEVRLVSEHSRPLAVIFAEQSDFFEERDRLVGGHEGHAEQVGGEAGVDEWAVVQDVKEALGGRVSGSLLKQGAMCVAEFNDRLLR